MENRTYRLGNLEVIPAAREIRRNGRKLPLSGQPYDVLICLLENPGRVVSREELKRRIWPEETFVDFDHGINKAINRIRGVLGDDAENPRFVETIPRSGYKFIFPLEIMEESSERTSSEAKPTKNKPQQPPGIDSSPHEKEGRNRKKIFQVTAAGFILLLLIIPLVYQGLKPNPLPRLFVFPLTNLSGDSAQNDFVDSMSNELISALAKLEMLEIPSWRTSAHYRQTSKRLPEIAREIGAGWALEGTVLRTGNVIKLNLQLLNARNDRHEWAEVYNCRLEQLAGLWNQIAVTIASRLKLNLSTADNRRLMRTHQVTQDAYENFLLGKNRLNRWTRKGFQEGIQYFEKAVAIQPDYAEAFAGLSVTYSTFTWFGYISSADACPQAKDSALKAIELDSLLAEAHTAMGLVHFMCDWDWTRADREFRTGLELNPGSSQAHEFYNAMLTFVGSPKTAREEAMRVYQLNPGIAFGAIWLGWSAFSLRDYDESIRWLKKTKELDASFYFADSELAWNYSLLGDHKRALHHYWATRDWLRPGEDLTQDATGGFVLARAGKKAEAEELLNIWLAKSRNEYVDPIILATFYNGFADIDASMVLYERGYRERSPQMASIKRDPMADCLRRDPRFLDLLHRMRFPE